MARRVRDPGESAVTESRAQAPGPSREGRPGEPRKGVIRAYIPDLASVIGLELDFYKSGHLHAARLDGRGISNAAATRLLGVTAWIGADGQPHLSGVTSRCLLTAEQIIDRIRQRGPGTWEVEDDEPEEDERPDDLDGDEDAPREDRATASPNPSPRDPATIATPAQYHYARRLQVELREALAWEQTPESIDSHLAVLSGILMKEIQSGMHPAYHQAVARYHATPKAQREQIRNWDLPSSVLDRLALQRLSERRVEQARDAEVDIATLTRQEISAFIDRNKTVAVV